MISRVSRFLFLAKIMHLTNKEKQPQFLQCTDKKPAATFLTLNWCSRSCLFRQWLVWPTWLWPQHIQRNQQIWSCALLSTHRFSFTFLVVILHSSSNLFGTEKSQALWPAAQSFSDYKKLRVSKMFLWNLLHSQHCSDFSRGKTAFITWVYTAFELD